MTDLDQKDLQILQVLQREGRITNQELSERVNLSPSPCLRRVKLMERSGVIRGYSAGVDQKAFGLPLTVFIRIKLTTHDQATVARFEAAVGDVREILDCFLMTGDADYLLRVVAADLDGYERFVRGVLQAIPGIAGIDTSFAYGTIKQSTVFPLPGI